MTEKILSYRASLDDVQVLDENNLRFVDFCKRGLDDLRRKRKDDLSDKVVLRLLLIILGSVVVGLTPLMSDVVLIVLEYIVGTVMVIIGTLSLVLLWRNRRHG